MPIAVETELGEDNLIEDDPDKEGLDILLQLESFV